MTTRTNVVLCSAAIAMTGLSCSTSATPVQQQHDHHDQQLSPSTFSPGPALSFFQLVKGYPLEYRVTPNDTSVFSWIPSVLLDEQTGFSQGSDGVILTRGAANQTIVWSLWGDGQSTPNHWWVNTFDLSQGSTSSAPADQLLPCPSIPGQCTELSAPLSIAGASHNFDGPSSNFTYDEKLKAHIALFTGDTPKLVALSPTEYEGDTCLCVSDLTPSSRDVEKAQMLLNTYDVAVDVHEHAAYFFCLPDNSHFAVLKYAYVQASSHHASPPPPPPQQVLDGGRPAGSPNIAAFVLSPETQLLWLVWGGRTNSTVLAYSTSDFSRGPVRSIGFEFEVSAFEPYDTSTCVVVSAVGDLFRFDCEQASSLEYVRSVLAHGSLPPPAFVALPTGRTAAARARALHDKSRGDGAPPSMFTLVSSDNTTVGQSLRWPVIHPTDAAGHLSFAIGSLSSSQESFGCTAWPCNRGPFQHTQLSPLSHSRRAVRATVHPQDTSGAFKLIDVDLATGEWVPFAQMQSQENTSYASWAWDAVADEAWMISPVESDQPTGSSQILDVATLARGDSDATFRFQIEVDQPPAASAFQEYVPIVFNSGARSSSSITLQKQQQQLLLLFLITSSGANAISIWSIDAKSGKTLSSHHYNVTVPSVFGDVDVNVDFGSIVVRNSSHDQHETALIVSASSMVDNRCGSTNSMWLLEFPFSSSSGELSEAFQQTALTCTGSLSSSVRPGQAQYWTEKDAVVFPGQNGRPWVTFNTSGNNETYLPPLLTPSLGYEWVLETH